MGDDPVPDKVLPEGSLASLGLDPGAVSHIECIHERHGSVLYRVVCGGRPFVLKHFGGQDAPEETRAYALLAEHGVPTLPVYGRATDALLLEDLDASLEWRLATEADAERAETGSAIAGWYRLLHAAGRRLCASPGGAPPFLERETDALDAAGLLAMGERLACGGSVWHLAADHIEALKAAQRALPETLNYNDFHWTNLALSRDEPLRAIVFDYHLLGIGMAYSDVRNVAGSLGPAARSAFLQAYGPTDPREAILDAPLSVLYSLHVALQLPALPSWAHGCLECVRSGKLERSLRRANEAASPAWKVFEAGRPIR